MVGLEGSQTAQRVDQVRLDGAIALVVGGEGQGMRLLVHDSCDVLVRLPMRGQVESLNASVAGSVALYMTWQRRGFGQTLSLGGVEFDRSETIDGLLRILIDSAPAR